MIFVPFIARENRTTANSAWGGWVRKRERLLFFEIESESRRPALQFPGQGPRGPDLIALTLPAFAKEKAKSQIPEQKFPGQKVTDHKKRQSPQALPYLVIFAPGGPCRFGRPTLMLVVLLVEGEAHKALPLKFLDGDF